ncbi:MAG: DUF4837 family protein [Paludibacteraceae bacterium]|nr:DUF4837 family protein [Paludibacteraceae bacterium]
MKKIGFILMMACVALCGCKKAAGMKVTATGAIYEVLVVMNDNLWQGASGDSVRAYLEADMPCLPQMESYFTLSHTNVANYDDALKATRNILFVDVNPERYTQSKITYKKDVYAHPQALALVTTPSVAEVAGFLGENGKAIQTFFLRQELERMASFYQKDYNASAMSAIQKKFGVSLSVPGDYQLIKEEEDFLWCCNDNGPKRKDVVIWSYPYVDKNQLTKEALCEKRDSVLKRINAYVEGSYMGTEYNIFPPVMQTISMHNAYCAELRGLWKMKGGAAMGGPFVQHTRIDEINQRVITVETFVYAAGQKKRNVYRQAEAILYTLQLPQDVNTLRDINVTGE